MDELAALKEKKLMQLQRQYQAAFEQKTAENQALQQQIDALESAVQPYLAKEAWMRYGALKTAHPEKAVHVLAMIGQAIEQGKIDVMISDAAFRELLRRLDQPKKEFKLKRV